MHLFPLFLLLLMLLPGAVHAAQQKSPEADLARVRERIGVLQKSVREDLARRDRLAVQLREAEVRVGEASKRLAAVRSAISASDRRLAALEVERQQNATRSQPSCARLTSTAVRSSSSSF